MAKPGATSDTVLLTGEYSTTDLTQASITFIVTSTTNSSTVSGAGAGKVHELGSLTVDLTDHGQTAMGEFSLRVPETLADPYLTYTLLAVPPGESPLMSSTIQPDSVSTVIGSSWSLTFHEQTIPAVSPTHSV
jgi:hypothetical protein